MKRLETKVMLSKIPIFRFDIIELLLRNNSIGGQHDGRFVGDWSIGCVVRGDRDLFWHGKAKDEVGGRVASA